MVLGDGELIVASPSNVGQLTIGWDEKLAAKVYVGVVVWDGAAPPVDGVGDKGELLGDYAFVADVWRSMSGVGPTFKVAHWGNVREEADDTGTTA